MDRLLRYPDYDDFETPTELDGIGRPERRVGRGAGEKLASPPTPTLPEPFWLCVSERIKVLSLNRMDDLSSDSKLYTARCASIGTKLQ